MPVSAPSTNGHTEARPVEEEQTLRSVWVCSVRHRASETQLPGCSTRGGGKRSNHSQCGWFWGQS